MLPGDAPLIAKAIVDRRGVEEAATGDAEANLGLAGVLARSCARTHDGARGVALPGAHRYHIGTRYHHLTLLRRRSHSSGGDHASRLWAPAHRRVGRAWERTSTLSRRATSAREGRASSRAGARMQPRRGGGSHANDRDAGRALARASHRRREDPSFHKQQPLLEPRPAGLEVSRLASTKGEMVIPGADGTDTFSR